MSGEIPRLFFSKDEAVRKPNEIYSHVSLFPEGTGPERREKSGLFQELASGTGLSGVAVACRMESERLEKLGFGPVEITGCPTGPIPRELMRHADRVG